MRLSLVSLAFAFAACGGGGNNNIATSDLTMDNTQPDLVDTTMMNTNPDMMCSPPSTLHPPKAGKTSLYCPFSGTPAIYCALGQHCCEPSSGTSTCDPIATPCPAGDTDWQCEDATADCTAGQVCCGTGMLVINTNPQCNNFASGFTGTHCAASCMASEIQMCTSNGECPAGKTCQPFKTKGSSVGGCQ